MTFQDLVDACDTYPEYLVETEDGELLGFDDEESVPEGAEAIEVADAIERLFDDGSVSYDFRGLVFSASEIASTLKTLVLNSEDGEWASNTMTLPSPRLRRGK